MQRVFMILVLMMGYQGWLMSAEQPEYAFSGDTPQDGTPVQQFRPRIIAMRPQVFFFEEGSGFVVDEAQARAVIDEAYLYLEQHFAPEPNQDLHTQQNRALIWQIIHSERPQSTAQVFARQNGNQRYLFINVFPSRSLTNQSRLQNELWRDPKPHSPAFWRIRYDLDRKQFFGFTYDLMG